MKRTIRRRTEITIETCVIKTIRVGGTSHETSVVELQPLVATSTDTDETVQSATKDKPPETN